MYDLASTSYKEKKVPVDIANLRDGESTCFHGFNEEFFFNRGKTIRRCGFVHWRCGNN